MVPGVLPSELIWFKTSFCWVIKYPCHQLEESSQEPRRTNTWAVVSRRASWAYSEDGGKRCLLDSSPFSALGAHSCSPAILSLLMGVIGPAQEVGHRPRTQASKEKAVLKMILQMKKSVCQVVRWMEGVSGLGRPVGVGDSRPGLPMATEGFYKLPISISPSFPNPHLVAKGLYLSSYKEKHLLAGKACSYSSKAHCQSFV